MPIVPSVGSRNVAGWSRPHVQSVGSPYAVAQLRARGVERRRDRRPVARRRPPGRRDVVPPRRGRVVEQARSAPATTHSPPTYSRASGPSSSSNSAAQQAVLDAHVRRAAERLSTSHVPSQSRIRSRSSRPSSGVAGSMPCEVRHRRGRPAGRACPSGSSRMSSVVTPPPATAVEQLDDPLRPVAGVPLGRDEVRVARRRPRRCWRVTIMPARRVELPRQLRRTGCSRSTRALPSLPRPDRGRRDRAGRRGSGCGPGRT